jgi:DNA-binding MarR family transcriptional regulator
MIRGIEGKRIFRDTQDRKDFVTRLGNLSEQTSNRILAWSLLGWVRAKIAWILSREYGIAMADIARQLGVCTSAIAKAIRKMEGED